MRISDWSSDVCSSDLAAAEGQLDLEGSSTPASTIAARRALAVDRLIDPMHAALDAQGLRKLHDEMEVPLVGVLARMEDLGVVVDRDELQHLRDRLVSAVDRPRLATVAARSEERGVGAAGVSTVRFGWSPDH